MTDPERGKPFMAENAGASARDAGIAADAVSPPAAPSAAGIQLVADKSELSKHEISVPLREDAALTRDKAVDLREANEHLVVAALNAQMAAEAAERLNRSAEAFLAMLAHELRNPLAPIRNAVAILERIATAHPQLPWIHDVIKRQADHMSRLLDDLLDVARVTSGKVVLQRQPLAVMEFLGQAIEASRPLIDARGQKLTLDIPPQPLYVDGDLARLTQVFSNLLNNASKYTDEGGSIALSGQIDGRNVILRVTDNGNGIPADTLPLIFDLFMQANRSLARAQGGLGIGLTVVRNLVEMHGGTVTAFSAGLEQGSELVVKLPLIDAGQDAALKVDEQPARAAGPAYKIVLIEDNIDGSKVVCMLLQLLGHEVYAAYDGVAGVALVKSSLPQVVLCDIGLPKMDGYAVIAKLRADMPAPQPLMIALTGYGQSEDRMRALQAGFDYHLIKPVDPDALMRLIASHDGRTREDRSAQ